MRVQECTGSCGRSEGSHYRVAVALLLDCSWAAASAPGCSPTAALVACLLQLSQLCSARHSCVSAAYFCVCSRTFLRTS